MGDAISMVAWWPYRTAQVFACRSTAPDTWDAPVVVAEWTDVSNPPSFRLVVTPTDSAILASLESRADVPFKVMVRRFEGERWTSWQTLVQRDTFVPQLPQTVGLTAFGDRSVLASWVEVDPSRHLRVFVGRYDFQERN